MTSTIRIGSLDLTSYQPYIFPEKTIGLRELNPTAKLRGQIQKIDVDMDIDLLTKMGDDHHILLIEGPSELYHMDILQRLFSKHHFYVGDNLSIPDEYPFDQSIDHRRIIALSKESRFIAPIFNESVLTVIDSKTNNPLVISFLNDVDLYFPDDKKMLTLEGFNKPGTTKLVKVTHPSEGIHVDCAEKMIQSGYQPVPGFNSNEDSQSKSSDHIFVKQYPAEKPNVLKAIVQLFLSIFFESYHGCSFENPQINCINLNGHKAQWITTEFHLLTQPSLISRIFFGFINFFLGLTKRS